MSAPTSAWQTTRNQLDIAAMAMESQEGDPKLKRVFVRQIGNSEECLAAHIQAGATTGGRFPRVNGVLQCPGAPLKKRKFDHLVDSAVEQVRSKQQSIQTLYSALENIHATLESARIILESSRFTTAEDKKLFEQLVKLFRDITITVHVTGEPTTARVMISDLCRLAATGGVMYYPLRDLHAAFVAACASIKSPFHQLD